MITFFIASAISATPTYNLPGSRGGGFLGIINNIANAMLALVATAAVLFMIIGAFQYVLAAGNEEMAEKGKKSITWAIRGLLIAILAWSIVNLLVTDTPLSNDYNVPTAVPSGTSALTSP